MYKVQLIYTVFILLAGTVQCEQPELPKDLEDYQNKLNEIPGLGNLNENAPSVEEIIATAQEKCEKNGGKEAFNRLMVAKDQIQECFESNFNLTQIQIELDEKRKSGSMDEVFAKYCKKRPIIEDCLKNLTGAVEPCLEESEKSSVKLLVNITENFIDFGCFKDGDRIANRRVIRSNGNSPELNTLLQAYDKLKQKYEPHCLQNGGSKASNEFQEALVQVEKCQNTVQTNFMRKIEEARGFAYDYMCNEFRYSLRGCLSNLTSKMEACLSRAEKYVPKFGLEIYDSLFKYQCKDNARALKMVLGEQDYCMKTILGATDVCIGKTKHIRDYSKEAVVTKSELCGDLKLLKNCFVDLGAQKCPGNTNINDLVKGFTDSIYAPCSGCNLMINLILLLILPFLGKLF